MTGGQVGSTVKLHIADGRLMVKTLGQEEKVLNGNGAKSNKFNVSEGIR